MYNLEEILSEKTKTYSEMSYTTVTRLNLTRSSGYSQAAGNAVRNESSFTLPVV